MTDKKTRSEKNLILLQEQLGGEVHHQNGIYSLQFSNGNGKGIIRCISFNKFMTSMEFDFILNNKTTLSIGSSERNMIYFFYTLQGKCAHQFDVENEPVVIDELRTSVACSRKQVVSQLVIEKGIQLTFSIIGINRSRYEGKFTDDFYGQSKQLRKLFKKLYEREESFHLGKLNLRIGEYVKSLDNNRYIHDLPTFLHYEGTSNLILAAQIEQFWREIKDMRNVSSLTKSELKSVKKAIDLVKKHPERPHSVTNLCEQAGLSPAKLQEGFKAIYGRTVSDFIRNTRLEVSERLIRTTDLNISQVVYSIGFTSRSYFCKIFKRKFGCSPKEYKVQAVVVPDEF